MSSLRPDSNKAHDLGTSSVKWGTAHVGDIQAETMTTSGDVEVQGNLTVTGTSTSLQVANLDVEDPLIKLARGNSSDAIDIGFYGLYNDGADKFAGLMRDATDSKFKLIHEMTSEPSTTFTGGSSATLVAGTFEGALSGNSTTATTLASAQNFAIGSGPVRAANVSFDGSGGVSLTSTIADAQITNAMLASSHISLKANGITQEDLNLGQSLNFEGTANEVTVAYSTVDNKYSFSLPDAVSGLTSVSATSLVGALTGNASTATALESARTFAIGSGPVQASAVSFDGTGNLSLTTTIADDQITNDMLANPSVTIGDGSNSEALALGGEFEIKGTTNEVDVVYSTSTNDFTIGLPNTITAALSGNATTATALAAAVNIGITGGPVRAANISFDGSGAVALQSTIANDQITDAMLAGSISNGNLANSTVSYGGVQLALGATDATPAFDLQDATAYRTSALVGDVADSQLAEDYIKVSEVDDSSIEVNGSGNLQVKGTGITNAMLAGSIANAKLANSGIELKLAGSSQETIALGSFIDIAGTSNEIDVAYSTGDNKFTFSLPSTINAATSGNAATSTKFAATKNIGITGGPVTAANIAFDGSGNVGLTSAIANDAITNAMIANDHLTLATTGTGDNFDIHFGDTLNINGTNDEVDVTIGSDAITIGLPSDVTIADDLAVGGNITSTGNVVVGGNLTAAAATVTLGDTLLELGVNNTSAKDHGFYSQRSSSSFCGFFFDETDDKFKVFTHDTEPSSDQVAVSGNYAKGNMDVGAVEVTSLDSSGLVAGELRMEGSAPASGSATGTAGDMRFDSANLYVCVATNTWKSVGLTGL